jgi:hypothetical protein
MTRSLCLIALPALALVCLTPRANRADEPAGWTDLTNLSSWKEPIKGWVLASSVSMDEKDGKKLIFTEIGDGARKEGKVILVNGKTGRSPDLLTKESFGDIELHAEFFIPKKSNSGVKFHAHYEIQICDSYAVKNPTGSDCGGIYPRADLKPVYHYLDTGIAPRSNAARPAGEWQTLDAVFLAPRFDEKGNKTTPARLVKVLLNGTLIHDNVELKTPTGHNWRNKEMERGPILLQGDHGPVAFRNVRVRPYRSEK